MTEKHKIGRVRHELRRRLLTVTATERLTPKMLRVTLAGEDLAGFVTAGYDDHVKLCFPQTGEDVPAWPAIGPDAARLPESSVASPLRDFTPRRYDAERGTLQIDFALHEDGPASDWAAKALPGSHLGVGGPRGSFVVADDFDWYLLIGDETALPAIGRRLEELRADTRAIVIAGVTGGAEEQAFTSRAALDLRWLHRPITAADDPTPWLAAIADLVLPDGDGYVWIAGETTVAKILRRVLVEERGVPRDWIKSAGYWRYGSQGFHENHGD